MWIVTVSNPQCIVCIGNLQFLASGVTLPSAFLLATSKTIIQCILDTKIATLKDDLSGLA